MTGTVTSLEANDWGSMIKRVAVIGLALFATGTGSAIAATTAGQDPAAVQKLKEIDSAMLAAPQVTVKYKSFDHGEHRSSRCTEYLDQIRHYFYLKCNTLELTLITPTAKFTRTPERPKCIKKRSGTSFLPEVLGEDWTADWINSNTVEAGSSASGEPFIHASDQITMGSWETYAYFDASTNLLTKSETFHGPAESVSGSDVGEQYAYSYTTPKRPVLKGKRCK